MAKIVHQSVSDDLRQYVKIQPDPSRKDFDEVEVQLAQTEQQIEDIAINAKMFNTVGDGVADDSLFLQNAINYAITHKKTLLIREKYRIKSTLLINGKLRIIGDKNAEIIVDSSLNDGIKITGENVIIDGISFTEETYDNYSTIEVRANNCVITNCRFNGNKVNGVLVKDKVSGTIITNNHFQNYYFMVICKGSVNNTISKNHFTGGAGADGGNGIKLMNDDSLGWANTEARGAHRNIITDNIFDGCLADGIDTYTDGSESIIANNIFRNCGQMGIEIKTIYRDSPSGSNGGSSVEEYRQNKHIIINSNIFIDFPNSLQAIRINNVEERSGYTQDTSKGVWGVTISNNIFRNVKHGVHVGGSRDIDIINNKFLEIVDRPVLLETNCLNISIDNNVFRSLSTNPYLIGIGSTTTKNIFIKNNKFIGFNNAGTYTALGIDVRGENVQITGNLFEVFNQSIKVNELTNSFISQNIFRNGTHSGIAFGSGGNIVLILSNLYNGVPRGIMYASGMSNIVANGNVYTNNSVAATTNEASVTNLQKVNEVII